MRWHPRAHYEIGYGLQQPMTEAPHAPPARELISSLGTDRSARRLAGVPTVLNSDRDAASAVRPADGGSTQRIRAGSASGVGPAVATAFGSSGPSSVSRFSASARKCYTGPRLVERCFDDASWWVVLSRTPCPLPKTSTCTRQPRVATLLISERTLAIRFGSPWICGPTRRASWP